MRYTTGDILEIQRYTTIELSTAGESCMSRCAYCWGGGATLIFALAIRSILRAYNSIYRWIWLVRWLFDAYLLGTALSKKPDRAYCKQWYCGSALKERAKVQPMVSGFGYFIWFCKDCEEIVALLVVYFYG